MLNGLDLFSGIGGLGLALDEWVRPIAYCESDLYAQAVLLSRMRSGELPLAPIWDDVRTLKGTQFRNPVDIIYGGFPCQDISLMGTGHGLEGERSGLFSEILRLAKELRPKFIFLENVPAIRTRGLDKIGQQLANAGYDCRWDIISAKEIGACHRRERWFLLAYSNGIDLRVESGRSFWENWKKTGKLKHDGREKYYTHAMRERLEGIRRESELPRPSTYGGWKSEPAICRRDNGVSNRVDRIKCLGNSVVPLQARTAFERLAGIVDL